MKIVKSNREKQKKVNIAKSKKHFFENYEPYSNINILATAKNYGVSRVTIYKWIKQIEG